MMKMEKSLTKSSPNSVNINPVEGYGGQLKPNRSITAINNSFINTEGYPITMSQFAPEVRNLVIW